MTQRTDEQPRTRNGERGPRAGAARSWYEVLELSRDATPEEIEAAYDRAINLIEGRSIAGYLMLDPESMESVRHDVETAFLVLSDPKARADFDAELARRERAGGAAEAPAERDTEIPSAVTLEDEAPEPSERDTEVPHDASSEGSAAERGSTPPSRRKLSLRILAPVEARSETRGEHPVVVQEQEPPSSGAVSSSLETSPSAPASADSRLPKLRFSPRAVVEEVSDPRPVRVVELPAEQQDNPLPADGEINGQVLRRVREARGVSIAELAEATKISKSYLIAMEEQDLDDLPARVYLRGFLTQVARVLKVDRTRLAEGYLAFVERYRR